MNNNLGLQNRNMGDNMFGDENHQEIARKALPILIEQAKKHQTINYSTLAHRLDIAPFGYPMPEMLSSIVTTLYELGQKWQEEIPYLTALVVTSGTGYPSYPLNTPNEVFDREFERIYNYPKWDAVLKILLSNEDPVETEEIVEVDDVAILTKSVHRWKRVAFALALAFVITLAALVIVVF